MNTTPTPVMPDPTTLLNLLKRVECATWSHGGHQYCPICREYYIKYGHAKDCELANTIKNLGGEVEFQD